MDLPTFLSSLVEALAWPVTVIVIVVLLRKPIAGLIPLVRKLKWKDFEIDFEQALQKAEREADAAQLPPSPAVADEHIPGFDLATRKMLRELAFTAPRAAVVATWRHLELALWNLLERHGVHVARKPARMLESVQRYDLLPSTILSLLDNLRVLRNQAAHAGDFDIDAARALEYVDLGERLASAMQSKIDAGRHSG